MRPRGVVDGHDLTDAPDRPPCSPTMQAYKSGTYTGHDVACTGVSIHAAGQVPAGVPSRATSRAATSYVVVIFIFPSGSVAPGADVIGDVAAQVH
jgi:hypothetical protein